MKTYRIFRDVRANSKDEAIDKFRATSDHVSEFRIQEDPFDDEEEAMVLKMAKVALADAEIFDMIALDMCVSDTELKRIQAKIEAITNR